MRFALIGNERTNAAFGLKGICPGCLQPVIARCGNQRIHHWAHNRSKICDTWWETETEWHRTWKNNFPESWQEIILFDEGTGEKHIADVRANDGHVIEFQHSHLNVQERIARENFYKNMVWVVDGNRLKRDYGRFQKGKDAFRIVKQGIFRAIHPEDCFPITWLSSSVPVIFDFGEYEQKNLYCLFDERIGGDAFIAQISRAAFIKAVINGDWSRRSGFFINNINQVKQEREAELKRQQERQAILRLNKFINARSYRKHKRF